MVTTAGSSDLGPEPSNSSAFGRGKFPDFFWHELELLRSPRGKKHGAQETGTAMAEASEEERDGARAKPAGRKR